MGRIKASLLWFTAFSYLSVTSAYAASPVRIFAHDAVPIAATDWYKLGRSFGALEPSATGERAWQFGLDKSPTAGVCISYLFNAKYFMGGACRDVLLLARHKEPAFHLGGMFGWDSAHAHSALLGRLGANIGPATAASLDKLAEKLPFLESLANFDSPPVLKYVGKITTVDVTAGPTTDTHTMLYGVGLKLDVPLADIWATLGGK